MPKLTLSKLDSNEAAIATNVQKLLNNNGITHTAYLPSHFKGNTVFPPFPVENIFICMEPSIRWMTKTAGITPLFNFLFSYEDFVLHACASQFPKKKNSYWITDVSKVASNVRTIAPYKGLIYPIWEKQLIDEIDSIGTPNCTIYFVGKPVENLFMDLKSNLNISITTKHPHKTLLHYSPQAQKYRSLPPSNWINPLSHGYIISLARRLLSSAYGTTGSSRNFAYFVLNRITNRGLSKNIARLIYTYYKQI